MNQYEFSLLTCPPDTSNAPANAACTGLARRLGLLALASDWMSVDAAVAASLTTTTMAKHIKFLCGMRLPDSLEVGQNGTSLNDAGNLLTCIGKRMMSDAQMTNQLTNLDKTGVDAGDFICAIVPPGADVSGSLSNEIVIPFGALNADAGTLIFGISNFTQREGGAALENPFSAACGFANFGPPSQFITTALPVVAMTPNPMLPNPGKGQANNLTSGYQPGLKG